MAKCRSEYAIGQVLAKAGEPLDNDQIDLLRLEYTRAMEERPLGKMATRAAAVLALAFVALLMCGIYMRYRQRGPLASLTRLLVLLLMAVVAVALVALGGNSAERTCAANCSPCCFLEW